MFHNLSMKILIVNGAKYYPFSEGKLNRTLMNKLIELLSPKHELKTTIVEEGYDIEEETEKFLWMDLVIFQSPVFWFSIPGIFKTYFDEVYRYGKIFAGSKEYGEGGLLKGKKYMYSFTVNPRKEDFGVLNNFFDGKSADDFFIALHKIQQFAGLEYIKSYFCYDVIHNPDIEKYLQGIEEHIKLNGIL